MKVSASILSCDFSNLERELKILETSNIDSVHMDIMDGNFVPNISFGPHTVSSLKTVLNAPFEIHLMISNPLFFVEKFTMGETLIFHVESNSNVEETIGKIKSLGKKVGISLKPKTNLESILNYLHLVDLVLVMTVEPGFGGQKFMESQVYKIKTLKKIIDEKNLNVEIEVDGGINDSTAKICHQNGANLAVAGTFIFNSKDIIQSINKLKSI